MKQKVKDCPVMKCGFCGREMAKTRGWKRYCSRRCKWQAWSARHPRVGVER